MKSPRNVRAFADQTTFIPSDAYDTLSNTQLFYCVVIFRFRNKKNRVFRPERELLRATGVAGHTKFEKQVLGPLSPYIEKQKRRWDHNSGQWCWAIRLKDPTVQPAGWHKRGKHFLKVPDWWLWQHWNKHPTGRGAVDHWVRTPGWNPADSTLRAALSLQRVDREGVGETWDKNTTYLAKSMGKDASVASTSLAKATDLGWIGGEFLSGGHGRRAHRWTRLSQTDPRTTEKRVSTGAGRKPKTQPAALAPAPVASPAACREETRGEARRDGAVHDVAGASGQSGDLGDRDGSDGRVEPATALEAGRVGDAGVDHGTTDMSGGDVPVRAVSHENAGRPGNCVETWDVSDPFAPGGPLEPWNQRRPVPGDAASSLGRVNRSIHALQ